MSHQKNTLFMNLKKMKKKKNKLSPLVLLFLIIAPIIYAQNKTRNEYIDLHVGTIIDSPFFKSIDSLLKYNPQVKKERSRIIELCFCVWTSPDRGRIASMEEETKEALFSEFFVSITPNIGYYPLFADKPIVVKYNGRHYLVESVVDSVLVKKGAKKRFRINKDMSDDYMNRNFYELIRLNQLIKFNNGLTTIILEGSDEYGAYHE